MVQRDRRPEVVLEADEINALIHAYLVESGFIHSAFTLKAEARLESTRFREMIIRRGELVDLLAKALLYAQVEAHYKQAPGTCNAPFKLLENHQCEYLPERDAELAEANGGLLPAPDLEQPTEYDEEMAPPSPDHRIPPAPVLSDSTQLYLTGGHSKMIMHMAWNPMFPNILATGGGDSIVCLWEVQWPAPQGQASYNFLASIEHCLNKASLEKEEGGFIDIFGLDWSPDGNFLASCCGDSVVRVWSKLTSKLVYAEKVHRATVVQVRWSPDGQYLASGSLDTTICLINFKTKEIVRRYHDIGGSVSALTWFNDHSFIATTSDGVIRIYQTSSAAAFRIFRGHTPGELPSIQLNSNRKALISVSEDTTARIWNITPLKSTYNQEKQEMEPAEGSVGGQSGQDCLVVLKGHSSDLWEAAWCPSADGTSEKFVATSSTDQTTRIWEAASGKCVKVIDDHRVGPGQTQTPVPTMSISPSGKYIATASGAHNTLYIHSLENFQRAFEWKDRSSRQGIWAIRWHKDGQRLAVGLGSNAAVILDVSHLNA